MSEITLLFPTFNRLEFTKVALETLLENTTPALVKQLLVVDGSSDDGTAEYLKERLKGRLPFPHRLITIKERHVVSAMLTAHEEAGTKFIGKVDSDTVVPAGWLDACADVVRRHPDLWALGIEPFSRIEDCANNKRNFKGAQFVGGIGLFRRECWSGLKASKPPFFGWTEHQQRSSFKKGWLDPAMRVILLDRAPFEPFLSLSKKYVEHKWQRAWPSYPASCAGRWEWKFPNWQGNGSDPEATVLTVGAYYHKVPGSVGISSEKGPATDVVCDLFSLSKQYSGVGYIYCYNEVQHVSWKRTPELFAEFFKALKPGGILEVGTIDAKDVCREYLSKKKPAERYLFLQHLYGEQVVPFDFHRALYDEETLAMLLKQAGFEGVKKTEAAHKWSGPLCMRGAKPK